MIRSFKNRETEELWNGESAGRFGDVERRAVKKLDMLNSAASLDDLRVPPGNRLEALKGDRQGQHSIRVNDQWRLCFVWTAEGPAEVELVDYH
jgi:toxin HigB-1